MIDFNGGPVTGDLDVHWIHGVPRKQAETDPLLQVHRYDDNTYILRQSLTVTHEAPFLFLLFGNDRCLLLDTGATDDAERFPLRTTVDTLIESWLSEHPREEYELVVAHSHAHGDHVAGDVQFEDRPNTRVVGKALDAVQSFFGFTDWPSEEVSFDLGGRRLELIGIPGHHATSLAIFDPWTGILLTGDTVYPGRLYGFDMPAYVDSMGRLVAFAEQRSVTHVMGCHIEMTRKPGRDYPLGAQYQPNEPPLQMTLSQLRAVRDAVRKFENRPGFHTLDDFIIVSGMQRRTLFRMLIRARLHRLLRR
ncbi:MBL fold metallo-hydrolase [uncultured Agrococcus sp.]|uniref:MBL fold metallo-hydrolase n=1 Tax=uncultured Agrococcus sp. TaxID=382258 RepID=UPI0025EA91A7|nr:MBL fold metallo-hydrolase [uncultured Agrococcus sp.]